MGLSLCDSLCVSVYGAAQSAMAESWKIHLVAVTSNGRRAYFTTSPYTRGGYGEERDLAKVCGGDPESGGCGVPPYLFVV